MVYGLEARGFCPTWHFQEERSFEPRCGLRPRTHAKENHDAFLQAIARILLRPRFARQDTVLVRLQPGRRQAPSASVWESRRPIDPVERVIFELTVERQRFRVRDELRIDPEELLDHWRASAVDRHAIERALVEHGHLFFTRRRIPLTIRPGKVARDV